jgi:hypothetical protein
MKPKRRAMVRRAPIELPQKIARRFFRGLESISPRAQGGAG